MYIYIRDNTKVRPKISFFFSVFYVLESLFFPVPIYFFKVVFLHILGQRCCDSICFFLLVKSPYSYQFRRPPSPRGQRFAKCGQKAWPWGLRRASRVMRVGPRHLWCRPTKQLASHLRPMSTFGCSGRSHSAGPAVPMEGAVWLFCRYKVQVNYSTLTVLKSNTKNEQGRRGI